MERTKVLLLTSRLPYPPIGGAWLKNYHLINILSKYFDVHLISITEDDVCSGFYDWAKEKKFSFRIFKKKKLSFIKNALIGILKNELPIQVNYYYFDDIQEYVNKIYKEFDLLIATLIRTAQYIINFRDKPKIIDFADSIALNYLHSKDKTNSIFWKILYSIEGKRLLKYEEKLLRTFDIGLFFNIFEQSFYTNRGFVNALWIPHGVDESLFKYNIDTTSLENTVVFFGKMNYQPNIDAVVWFYKNVLPKLDDKINFLVIGAYPTQTLYKLEKKSKRKLKVLGFVEDPYYYLRNSLAVVAPMQTGGGIQTKILETMAVEGLVITSSLSAKPIVGARNFQEFIVIDDPDEMADFINRTYRDRERYTQIRHNAREFIKENFTWSIYEKKLLEYINKILGNKL